MENFKSKFRVEELIIVKVGHWNVSLRPEQPTVGSLVLSLERKCPALGMLTMQESIDMCRAISIIEGIYQKTFMPEKINYLALMMVDEQVHFHVVPRYECELVFLDKIYNDRFWPKLHNLEPLSDFDEDKIQVLKNMLREALQSEI